MDGTRLDTPAGRAARIVIIKPCCAGDVVMATAALAALRRAYPDAEITWAVHAWGRPLLAHDPRLHALLDTGPLGTRAAGRVPLRAVEDLATRLQAGRYDACLVLDRSPWLTVAAWGAAIPVRVGFDSGGRGILHTRRIPAGTGSVAHEVALYLACARALGAPTDDAYPAFHPSAEECAWAETQVQAWAGAGPLVLLNPAGGSNPGMQLDVKRWPPAHFAALGARLAAAGARVALVAGPNDGALLAAVQAQMPARPPVCALTWGQAGALARHAALYVGNDTGLTHVAAAVGTRVVAIFGPSDPARYAPYAPPGQVRVAWRPTALPAGGVAAGAPRDFTWETHGVSVEEVAALAEAAL